MAKGCSCLTRLRADRPQTNPDMKKRIPIILEDADIIELMRILLDDDTEVALPFLKRHFKGKAREFLEAC